VGYSQSEFSTFFTTVRNSNIQQIKTQKPSPVYHHDNLLSSIEKEQDQRLCRTHQKNHLVLDL